MPRHPTLPLSPAGMATHAAWLSRQYAVMATLLVQVQSRLKGLCARISAVSLVVGVTTSSHVRLTRAHRADTKVTMRA